MRKSEPKRSCRLNRLAVSFLVGLWAVTPGWVNALPNGGQIVSGTGSISQPSAQDMLIQQDSQQLITNWQGFSIGSAESVTFNQLNSSAVALNRVIGVDPSIILGKLSANVQVFLTNPSGVVFGKGAVLFTLLNGGDLNLAPGNSNGNLGGNDLGHITAENLILKTDGNIDVKGITKRNTDGITDSVILESRGNITFEGVASAFPALKLSAVNDINVNADITTTKSDFIAVADSEGNGKGDFNVAHGVVIASARDIDVSAPNINADESSFKETRNLILNGNGVSNGSQTSIDTDSIQQGTLSAFLTEFFENGGPGGC